jgi:HD-like signal output (HDOD) protein
VRERPAENSTVEERLVRELGQIVLNRIASDRLLLPCFPSASLRCQRVLRDPDAQPRQLTEAVERDPVLAVQVLRLAGANGGSPPRSLEHAITRVGVPKLRAPLGEMLARQLTESKNRRIAEACRGLWDHSIGVALLSRDLAALAGADDSDFAYLVGLVHDIGKLVLAGMLLEAERQLSRARNATWISPEAWLQAISDGHRQVGLALAEKWSLPEPIVSCIKDTSEYNAGDRAAATNFVCFANALAKRSGLAVGPYDADDVGALAVIGRSMLGLDEELVARLSGAIGDRVRPLLD